MNIYEDWLSDHPCSISSINSPLSTKLPWKQTFSEDMPLWGILTLTTQSRNQKLIATFTISKSFSYPLVEPQDPQTLGLQLITPTLNTVFHPVQYIHTPALKGYHNWMGKFFSTYIFRQHAQENRKKCMFLRIHKSFVWLGKWECCSTTESLVLNTKTEPNKLSYPLM